MMNDSKRSTLRGFCSAVLILGLMALMVETRSTGEALERFRVILLLDPVSVVGAGVAALALLGFAVIQVSAHKEHRKHLHRHV
jgi:hypothetical protein